MEELIKIQSELKVGKTQYNAFGKYNYRSCEDILEALKPLCLKYSCYITLTDDIVFIGDRFYVKATARITSKETFVESVAFAREPESRKGMDASQITGASSSYARKYALAGLLNLDDTKDADTMDNRQTVSEWQKSVLKNCTVILDRIGSESCQRATTAIMQFLGNEANSFEDAEHLIKKVEATIKKESQNDDK